MKQISLKFVVSGVLFLASLAWLKVASELPIASSVTTFAGPGTFPLLILSIMVVGSFVVTLAEFRNVMKGKAEASQTTDSDYKRVGALVATAAIYAISIEYVGYIPATIFLLFVTLLLFGARNKLALALVSTLFPIAIYCLFKLILQVQLP